MRLEIDIQIDIRGQARMSVQNSCKPANHDIAHVQIGESLEDRNIERHADIIE